MSTSPGNIPYSILKLSEGKPGLRKCRIWKTPFLNTFGQGRPQTHRVPPTWLTLLGSPSFEVFAELRNTRKWRCWKCLLFQLSKTTSVPVAWFLQSCCPTFQMWILIEFWQSWKFLPLKMFLTAPWGSGVFKFHRRSPWLSWHNTHGRTFPKTSSDHLKSRKRGIFTWRNIPW